MPDWSVMVVPPSRVSTTWSRHATGADAGGDVVAVVALGLVQRPRPPSRSSGWTWSLTGSPGISPRLDPRSRSTARWSTRRHAAAGRSRQSRSGDSSAATRGAPVVRLPFVPVIVSGRPAGRQDSSGDRRFLADRHGSSLRRSIPYFRLLFGHVRSATTRPFAPARLGPLTLRNRTIKPPPSGRHAQRAVSDDLVKFHRRVAAGGVGMTTVAYCAVSRDGRVNATPW